MNEFRDLKAERGIVKIRYDFFYQLFFMNCPDFYEFAQNKLRRLVKFPIFIMFPPILFVKLQPTITTQYREGTYLNHV